MIQVLARKEAFVELPDFHDSFATPDAIYDNRVWVDTCWESIEEAREKKPHAIFREVDIISDPVEDTA